MSSLVPCAGCNRHLKSNESACPFCGRALGVLVAAGAALLGAACQSSTSVIAPYGTPPQVDTGAQTHVDAGASTDATHDAGDAEK